MLGRLERLARDECADERLDQPRLLARDDAEDRELVVPAADNALIAPPRQYRLDMSGAKALPGALDRKSVVEGQSVSVSVNLGGRGIIKNTTPKQTTKNTK